jgi:ribonuclease HI
MKPLSSRTVLAWGTPVLGATLQWSPSQGEKIIFGRDRITTNNKMEMIAAIKALEAVPQGLPIVIHSDSQYVVKGATEWLRGWNAKGWRKADGKPVMNQDLWMQMDAVMVGWKITWR